MKRFIICLIFLFNYSFGIVLNKVKITGNTHTDTKTILEIASDLKEGKDYKEEELKKIAARIEERLKNTGWFYSANVYIVETTQGEKYRNVIIEVDEGFLYRFYGGNAYGGFGMDNVFGGGEKYRIELGLNRQHLKFEKLFATYHLKLSTTLGNLNEIIYSENGDEVKIQSVGVKQVVYYLINWDLSIYLNGEYRRNFDTSYNKLFDSYYAGGGILLDKRNSNFYPTKGFYVALDYKHLDFKYYRFGLDSRIFIPLFDGFSLGTRLIYSIEDINVPYYYRFCVLGIEGVRGIKNDVPDNSLIQANVEVRWKFFNIRLFSMIDTIFEAVIFSDAGKSFVDFNEVKDFRDYQLGYGTGLRIYFDNPVFLPLRFEVGFDKDYKAVFYFDISYPF